MMADKDSPYAKAFDTFGKLQGDYKIKAKEYMNSIMHRFNDDNPIPAAEIEAEMNKWYGEQEAHLNQAAAPNAHGPSHHKETHSHEKANLEERVGGHYSSPNSTGKKTDAVTLIGMAALFGILYLAGIPYVPPA